MAKRRSRTEPGFAAGEPRAPSSRRLSTRPEGRPSPLDDLPSAAHALRALGVTPREAEILVWVARGKTYREIATILGISPQTVSSHTRHIFLKLGVTRRTATPVVFDTLYRQRPPESP